MAKVWNKHDPNVPPNAVYVGRPSKWGNPFEIGKHYGPGGPLTRAEAVQAFRDNASICRRPQEIITELKGKDLVCWCAPLACHGDVLLEIANESINPK